MLASTSRKLQAQASQDACLATGACTPPKRHMPATGDLPQAAMEGRAEPSAPAAADVPSPTAGPDRGGMHDVTAEAM